MSRCFSWPALRAWSVQRAALLLAVAVLAYLGGFFLYQAWSSVDELAWQRAADYRLADRCRLLVEYPARLRLEPPDGAGRPVTIRLWADSDGAGAAPDLGQPCSSTFSLALPVTYVVQLGPVGGPLEFTDSAGELAPASVSPVLASSASSAAPLRLYVRQAPSAAGPSSPLVIQAQMVDAWGRHAALAVKSSLTPEVGLESAGQARLRRMMHILFTPGPLQWLFTALGGLFGVWELYRGVQQKRDEKREKETERRRAQRERIAALGRIEQAADAFHVYLALRSELADKPAALDELRAFFQPEWLPYLRLQLGRLLRSEQLDEARAAVAALEWEWRQAADASPLPALHALIECLRQPRLSLDRGTLDVLLEGFRAVGLGAAAPITRRLAQAAAAGLDDPTSALVEEVLLIQGCAGGRYLLNLWAAQDVRLQVALKQWERRDAPALPRAARSTALWPRDRAETRSGQAAIAALGMDLNPFGPEKAEHDPHLPDLFFCPSPAWDQLVAPRPGLFIAPPGSGRTSLLWMVRYESGLRGSDLERVFPVWVPLYDCSTPEELACLLQKATAAEMCRTLAGDPFALLGLAHPQQQALADLLLLSLGGLPEVVQHLRRAGLRDQDPDGRLLHEALSVMSRRRAAAGAPAGWDAVHLCPSGADYCFLLIDVAGDDETTIDTVLASVFERWLALFAPRHIVPKVFVSGAPGACPIQPLALTWDRQSLAALLRFRLQRSGLIAEPGRPALEGWVEGHDVEAALLDAAAASPARLVRLGNRLVDRLAEPRPLADGQLGALLKE